MKLKITYTNFNVLVPRLVAKVYKVTPFGLPDGILTSLFTAKGQIMASSAADTAAVIPAPAQDGLTLISDSSQTTGYRVGTPIVDIADTTNNLINPGFDLAQRQAPGTDTTITDEKYSADRWRITRETAALQYSRQSAAGESGLSSRYFGKFTKITNAGKFLVYQPLEYIATIPLRGRDVICQLQMKASSAKTVKLAVIELQAAGTEDTFPAAFVAAWNIGTTDPTLGANLAVVGSTSCSVTTAWQLFTVAATIPSDSKNLAVAIWSDADFSDADFLCLAEAGLYRGTSAQIWAPRNIAHETMLCRRYYCKSYELPTAPGTATSLGRRAGLAQTTSFVTPFESFSVPMRSSTPTIALYSLAGTASALSSFTPADVGAAATAAAYRSALGFYAINDAAAPYTAAVMYYFHYTADAEL